MDRKRSAFTLVELLVVISIIAMLLAVLMPALSKARAGAKRLLDAGNMHNLGLTIANFRQNNNNAFPGAWWGNNVDGYHRRTFYESLIIDGQIAGKETVKGNDEWVVSAASTRAAYSCPSFRDFLKRKGSLVVGWSSVDLIAQYYPIGYGYNAHLSQYDQWDYNKNVPFASVGWTCAGPRANSETLILVDSSSFFLYNMAGGRFYPVYEMQARFVSQNGSIVGSHIGSTANALWADMHVKAKKADEFCMRNSQNRSQLEGACVLDKQAHQFTDMGYTSSTPKGKIATIE